MMRIILSIVRILLTKVFLVICVLFFILNLLSFLILFIDYTLYKKEIASINQANHNYINTRPEEKIAGITQIKDRYYTDGSKVYFGKDENNLTEIKGLHPKNLRIILNETSDTYTPDILINDTQLFVVNSDYNKVWEEKVKNPKNFIEISHDIFSDGEDTYLRELKLLPLNIKNPKIVPESSFIKGDGVVYYLNSGEGLGQLPGADPETFEVIKSKLTGLHQINDKAHYSYGKDSKNVFFEARLIKNADPSSFSVFERSYYQDFAKDNTRVYFEGEEIFGADVSSFEVISRQPWEGCGSNRVISKDKNHVYYKTKIIIGADPKTFKSLHSGYSTDANKSFYGSIEVKIDPKDLEVPCYYG